MSIKRLAAAAGFVAALMTNVAALASPVSSVCTQDALQVLFAAAQAGGDSLFPLPLPSVISVSAYAENAAQNEIPQADDPRQLLVELALDQRDVRYRRGGRSPSTGFDCSGFVHFVFARALGVDLPANAVSQFRAGIRVARDDMKTGDLVFFRIHGKRISHVGIYLGNGRFIHAPTTGQRVRVDRMDQRYWAHRFAGAKRLQVLG